MKIEIMALALLFAALGLINSHASPVSFGQAFQVIGEQTGNSHRLWLDPSWQPALEVQILLFGALAAVGLVTFVYYIRLREEEKSMDQDWE